MASFLGIAALAIGLLVAGGAWYLQGEVAAACSTQQAQTGLLIGDPDAQACRTYPPLLGTAQLAGFGVAVLGLVVLVLRR